VGVEIDLFGKLLKKAFKRYERKTNDFLIAFIGYVNDLSNLQQFKLSVKKSHH
jgi:hypothetical protein